jgi:ribonucleoside-diphosphate reductase alpha chain
MGIQTADERARALDSNYGATEAVINDEVETAPKIQSVEITSKPAQQVGSSTELLESMLGRSQDAPMCVTCGTKMRPAGSCYVCEGCGSTSGCS